MSTTEKASRRPSRILVVDDDRQSRDILAARLSSAGAYETLTASDGEEALALARTDHPDLILLDVVMPGMDGLEVCRHLKADPSIPFTPIILITARSESSDVVAGLTAGGDEYLAKPVDSTALIARVVSMLRIKELHDTVQEQAARLKAQAQELADLNHTLDGRVRDQVTQLERLGRLRRFLPPQITELILSAEGEALLESHRREIAVICCGLQGFASFAETAEPEVVVAFLREYYEVLGALIHRFEGTVERIGGGSVTIIFNDPLTCPDPAARVVQLAVAARERINAFSREWQKRGYELGFGVGADVGYATLGILGFQGRFDYGAVGTVVNLATRLCDEAQDGQILVTQRIHAAIEDQVNATSLGDLNLRGFIKPVRVFDIADWRTDTDSGRQAWTKPRSQARAAAAAPLTPRECEVAEMLAAGLSNREIAQRLVLSERTAERHVENIREKLGVTSRAQIAVWAVEHGLHRETG